MCTETKYTGILTKLFPGRLSNQGEKRINLYFIIVPLRKTKVLKYGTPKPSSGLYMKP